ncbi:MAG: arsenate reductase ArsC [Chloroflexaceae bacterium]|nr:arsenate reductase ArsC [Chloroflexaceae bacterium]
MTNASVGEDPKRLFRVLADEAGWHLVHRLSRSDERLDDLVAALGHPKEVLAAHLSTLGEMGLVGERQSEANPADRFYRLDLARMRETYLAAGVALHPVVGGAEALPTSLPCKPRVLFLCTGNSARSQMAEGYLRHLSQGQVEVASAGTRPSQVHPLAIEMMARAGIDLSHHRSKHLDEFLGQSFDYIITVCDYQREICPVFPVDPERIHWGFPDPVEVVGKEAQEQAFKTTAVQLRSMIRNFLILLNRKEQETV